MPFPVAWAQRQGAAKDLSPDLLVSIGQAARGQVPVAFGASPDEALWLTAPKRATGRPAAPKGAAVHRLRFGAEVVTRRYSGAQLPHFIQRTRGGLLFVNARQPDDEPNAWVTNDAGRVVRRLALGDGLSDVRVSPRGKIWTAYFDEGVFGGGAGAAGLLARDGAGRKVWACDARKAGTDDIADVYALNLAAEDDAWVYFYQPFAQPFVIVRWQKNRPTTWRTRVEGAQAIQDVRPARAAASRNIVRARPAYRARGEQHLALAPAQSFSRYAPVDGRELREAAQQAAPEPAPGDAASPAAPFLLRMTP